MPEAWDTTTAARLRPDSPVLDYATSRWQAGDPIAFTASTLSEVSYGLSKAAAAGNHAAVRQLRWLRAQIGGGLVEVLAFNERAADLAGAVRAHMPFPALTVGKRPKDRSKADSRVAWIMDIQIATTVFAHGYDLVSADAHYPVIARHVSALAAAAPELVIHAPPSF